MRLPDYNRSLLSISASIMAHYGDSVNYPTLPELDEALKTPTRTVILILLDGMGENLLKKRLPAHAFLNQYDIGPITTVFPSTTTAATTSLWTGLSPQEHGWLGWSLYFKECGRQIDAFMDRDSHTQDKYAYCSPASKYMPLPSAYARIKDRVQTHALFPFRSSAAGAEYSHTISGFADYARVIRSLAHEPNPKLICAYYPEPDHSMHATGVTSPATQEQFNQLNAQAEKLCMSLPEDALVIITADHGLVDVDEQIYLNEIPEIMECLIMPPSIEARAASLFIKPHKRAQFEAAFNAHMGADFELYTHAQVFDMGLMGRGRAHPKADDFVGDYLACATGSRSIKFKTPATDPDFRLIGQHSGLTDDEMLIPVILHRNAAR